MGAWGTGLYQDDTAMEVRDYYQELLKKGISNEESLDCLLEAFEEVLEDADDAPPFWFSLADTQWKLGRLTDEVREQALALLTSGADLARWEDATKGQKNARKKVLQALQERLQSPQPPEKKIRVPRLYHTDWKFGDLYAMQLCGETAKTNGLDGRYLLFHKVREMTWYPGHIIPIVHVKLTYTAEIPKDSNEIDKLPYIQISSDNPNDDTFENRLTEKPLTKADLNELGYYPVYEIGLIFTSKRSIPKDLIYVGSFTQISMPSSEIIYSDTISVPVVRPKDIESRIIERYLGHNLRQYAIYQRKQ